MKLKYRIKMISFPFDVPSCWVSQYRIFGIWLSIGNTRGHFGFPSITYCESFEEAKDRIRKHKLILRRASKWYAKRIRLVEEDS